MVFTKLSGFQEEIYGSGKIGDPSFSDSSFVIHRPGRCLWIMSAVCKALFIVDVIMPV